MAFDVHRVSVVVIALLVIAFGTETASAARSGSGYRPPAYRPPPPRPPAPKPMQPKSVPKQGQAQKASPKQSPGVTQQKKAAGSQATQQGIDGAKTGRAKNKLAPTPGATGDHTAIKRDKGGKISNYSTYEKNPKNPSGFQEKKRVDVTGRPHVNPDGTVVGTPHVSEQGKKGVRPARPDEVPKK